MSYQVSVFISHSWANSGHYDKLSSWIFDNSWNLNGTPISFLDVSVPKNNPIHYASTDAELYAQISRRILQSNLLVCPTGLYSTHSKWISKELEAARKLGKAIVGVNPWGQERKSTVVRDAADETVGWTKQSVINAIWKYR